MSINDYELIKELGKGSMGVVYLARDHKLERFVAIKKLKVSYEFELSHEDEVVKRFYREARALAGLSHPNFVMVHEVGENKALNEHYIVMEYIEGESLDQMVDSRGALPLNIALKIGIQACEALNHIHAKKFIHRDIKPANLILCKNGVLKIMDFGLVKTEDLDLTKPGTIMGSALFMPAEQIFSIKNIDHRVDIYSLGVTLYYILTGVYPFACNNLQDLVIKIKNGSYQNLTEVNNNLPKELEYIIHKAISLNREDRYNNMFEFQQCLADFNDKKVNTLIFPFRYDLKIKSITELKNDFQKIDQKRLIEKDYQNNEQMVVKADEQFVGKIIDLSEKNNLKGKETIPSVNRYTATNELLPGDLLPEEIRESNYNSVFIDNIKKIVHETKLIYASLKKESINNDEELKNLLAKYEKTKDKAYSHSLKMIKQLIEVKELKNEKYKREKALFLKKIKIYDRILNSAKKRGEIINYLLKNVFFDYFDFITINNEELKRINHYFTEIIQENKQLNSFYQECQDNLTSFSEINESLTEQSEPIAILYHFEEEKQTATVRLFGEISKESFIEFDGEENIIFTKCLVNTNNEEQEVNRKIRKILIGKTNNISKSVFPGCHIFKSNKRVFRKEFIEREINSLIGLMKTIQETKEELYLNFNGTCQEILKEIQPSFTKESLTERLVRNKSGLKETTALLEKFISEIAEPKVDNSAEQLFESLKMIND